MQPNVNLLFLLALLSTTTLSASSLKKAQKSDEKTAVEVQNKPVVAIVALEERQGENKGNWFISRSNIEWLKQAGLDWMPLFIDDPRFAEKLQLANGVFLTGGMQNLFEDDPVDQDGKLDEEKAQALKSVRQNARVRSKYLEFVKRIVEYSKAANEQRVFPVWGTCLGFQSLLLSLTDFQAQISQDFHHNKVFDTISFAGGKENAFSSRIDAQKIAQMKQNNFVYYNHFFGFRLTKKLIQTMNKNNLQLDAFSAFYNSENLSKEEKERKLLKIRQATFSSTKTNEKEAKIEVKINENPNKKNKVVVASAFHHLTYPFYGLQFHPEATEFSHHKNVDYPKNKAAKIIAKTFGEIFRDLFRKGFLVADKEKVREMQNASFLRVAQKSGRQLSGALGRIYFGKTDAEILV